MSGWRKCDTCRKVRPIEEFDGGSPTCRACRVATSRRRSASAVVSRPTSPTGTGSGTPATRRTTPLSAVGMGDVEVRERRAKRAAWEALAAAHPAEFAALLWEARQAEGLRTQPAARPDSGDTGLREG